MKGDFSRDTFNPLRHFHGVLMQQGRVQLDADWNEQQAIQLYLLRRFIADLIGPYGTPCRRGKLEKGFNIRLKDRNPFIGRGTYYVDGILCENLPEDGNEEVPFSDQEDWPFPPPAANEVPYLVYLDVWERHICSLENDDIREKALGGPDTTSRRKVVWQVKGAHVDKESLPKNPIEIDEWKTGQNGCWKELVATWQSPNRGLLRAQAKTDKEESTGKPCLVSPDARYRGNENRLYRVEIHRGGVVGTDAPTFKWSRENGSVIFPIAEPFIEKNGKMKITLETLGRDRRLGLSVGDWVEVIDDAYVLKNELKNEVRPLFTVTDIDAAELKITVSGTLDAQIDFKKGHPLVRRWDQKDTSGVTLVYGSIPIQEVQDTSSEDWIPLEDGIWIQFRSLGQIPQHRYRTGDYWLIPARAATEDIEWPAMAGSVVPKFLPPFGVEHHYAPLALVTALTGSPADLRTGMKLQCADGLKKK